MKAVLISIQPEWCEKITSGEKTLEVRKNRPKLETPFKCYIYCTKSNDMLWVLNTISRMEYGFSTVCANLKDPEGACAGNGKVIGEFTCDAILPMSIEYSNPNSRVALKEFPGTCLTDKQIIDYLGNGVTGYAWHISNLIIYEKPKKLSDFTGIKTMRDGFELRVLERPPQSWCYVKEV